MATFSTVTGLAITASGIADGNGRISDGVDNSTTLYQRIHWYSKFTSGGTPTAGTLYEVYGFREDNYTPEYTSDGETLTDGALSATPENAQLIGTVVVTATSGKAFYGEGVWADPGPGRWAIGFMNETAAATEAILSTDNFINWVGEKA